MGITPKEMKVIHVSRIAIPLPNALID